MSVVLHELSHGYAAVASGRSDAAHPGPADAQSIKTFGSCRLSSGADYHLVVRLYFWLGQAGRIGIHIT